MKASEESLNLQGEKNNEITALFSLLPLKKKRGDAFSRKREVIVKK
jgi:hypothetical protein